MVESFCRSTQLWIHGFLLFRVCMCVGGGGVGHVSMRASGGVVNEKCGGGGIVRC